MQSLVPEVASATKLKNAGSTAICYFLLLLGLSAAQRYKLKTLSLPLSEQVAFEVTFSKVQARVF